MSRATFLPLVLSAVVGVLAVPEVSIAQTEQHEFNIPITFTTPNPCNAELVAIVGTVDLLTQITADQAGGIHMKSHIARKGTGLGSLGNEYVFSEEEDIETSLSGPSTTFTFTDVLDHVLISSGATDNFIMRIRLHVTVSNGVPAPSLGPPEFDCRG